MRILIGAALGAALFTCASAQDRLPLSLPLDCSLGQTCFVTALKDHDIGSFSVDYSCGTLTRDGHSGTDFTLPDLAAMERGVNVLAAASGTIMGIRDRLPDNGPTTGMKTAEMVLFFPTEMAGKLRIVTCVWAHSPLRPGSVLRQGIYWDKWGARALQHCPTFTSASDKTARK